MAHRRRTGRPRAGEATLTRERILRTALGLVDSEGVAALSMRRLAAALEVDPMAIYHHLDGKHEVIRGLVEMAFSGLAIPGSEEGDWRAQVLALAGAYRDLALSHPNLILHLVTDPGTAAAAVLDLNEALYSALERAGLPPRRVPAAADLIVDYIHGYVLGAAKGHQAQQEPPHMLGHLLDTQAEDAYPAMQRALESLAPGESPGSFEEGVALIIAGVAASAA